MKTNLLITASLLSLTFFVACTEEDDTTTSTTATTATTSTTSTTATTSSTSGSTSVIGSWLMTAETIRLVGAGVDTTYDEHTPKPACEKDDIFRFNADKTATLLAGATKCDPSDPDSEPQGTWELLNNNTKIQMSDNGTVFTFDIKSLTATSLVLEQIVTDAGQTSTWTQTFTRQ